MKLNYACDVVILKIFIAPQCLMPPPMVILNLSVKRKIDLLVLKFKEDKIENNSKITRQVNILNLINT